MNSLTIKYARNGALASIGLYLMIAIPLLTLSLSYVKTQSQASAVPQPDLTADQQGSRRLAAELNSITLPHSLSQAGRPSNCTTASD